MCHEIKGGGCQKDEVNKCVPIKSISLFRAARKNTKKEPNLNEHHIQLLCLVFALLNEIKYFVLKNKQTQSMDRERTCLGGDLPLLGQVGLVADQHDDHVGATLGAHVVNPLGRLVERVGVYFANHQT